jgi:hypothetical protein
LTYKGQVAASVKKSSGFTAGIRERLRQVGLGYWVDSKLQVLGYLNPCEKPIGCVGCTQEGEETVVMRQEAGCKEPPSGL